MYGYALTLIALAFGLIGAPWGSAIMIAALLALPMVVRGLSSFQPEAVTFAPSAALSFLNASVFMLLSFWLGRVIALLVL